MHIQFAAQRPADAEILVLPVEKGAIDRLQTSGLDAEIGSLIREAAAANRFEGEAGATSDVFAKVDGSLRRVVLLGVGSGSEPDYERAGGTIASRFVAAGSKSAVIDFGALSAAPTAKAAARLAAGAAQKAWRYDVYRTKQPERAKPTLETLTVIGAPDGMDEAWKLSDAVTKGMELTRMLVSEPANNLYPESFVEHARDLEQFGIELTVLDEAQMRELGMNALLGVSQGSRREARLLVMRWNGKGEGNPDLALVGKGVTFDSGGISLKPGAGMEDMKWDMGGAGAVIGAMKTLALRKAKANVVGVCGLVENMPDGNAQRPGDVVTSMSGQTIEVINTDAEGRLVLCDALCWVQRNLKPKTIIDLATLTGAMIVSLGHEQAGLFANDDSLADELTAAGQASGDRLWRMPMGEAYN